MTPAWLLAASLLSQSAEPATISSPAKARGTLSFGTGMRYGMFGLRGALPLHESLWVSAAIGVPPQVYNGVIDDWGDFREDLVPVLFYMEEGWPAFAAGLVLHLPIGETLSFQAAFTSMFMRGHRANGNAIDGVSQTALAFSLVLGVQLELYGPIYADLGLGPSLTHSDIDWVEDEFDRTRIDLGLDWVFGVGYEFL